jgi:hypothetical protein
MLKTTLTYGKLPSFFFLWTFNADHLIICNPKANKKGKAIYNGWTLSLP